MLWWWRVAYLDGEGTEFLHDANEIHIAAGRPVLLELERVFARTDAAIVAQLADEIIVMRDGAISARFDMAEDDPTTLDLLEKMV